LKGQEKSKVAMTLYLYRLIPPRTKSFALDMTPDEAKVMRAHVEYWKEYTAIGKVLVFGPVADPEGAFGIAVITAEDGEDLAPLCQGDPAIRSALGFSYKLHFMPQYGLSSKVSG
jgi:uncharacterized protein YciI